MNYIENIYICLVAPVLITVLCLDSSRRRMVFFLAGMTACLFSSYISTFFASVLGISLQTASLEISPMVEEVMKLIPLLFYLLVFEPRKEEIPDKVLMIAVGFATFENVCFLIQNGASGLLSLLIRGFSTGTMHVVCGKLVSLGMFHLWDRLWLRVAGTFGLLSMAITYHSIFNLLVSQEGTAATVGFLIPAATFLVYYIFGNRRLPEAGRS